MRHLLTLALSLFFLCPCVPAQNIGLHPPRLEWKQLEAGDVRIIFPENYEARARRVGALIETLDREHRHTIGEKSYRADLILQTENTTINGYVGLAPFRSEFFTTPPQTLSTLSNSDWVDLLTVHEYRHIQQASNERRGLTNLVSYLQGQNGWAALSTIAVPNWFAEGDAVIFETALTPSGRGRTPAFSSDLRALLENDVIYSYPKARNGSFRDLVPDHYRYGYAMLTYARQRFGSEVWRPILHQGASYRGLLYSFSRATKRATGMTTPELYRTVMEELETKQDSLAAAIGERVVGVPLSRFSMVPHQYRFPQATAAGYYTLKSSYRQLPTLVRLIPGSMKEEKLVTVGIQREPWLDVEGNTALWTEYRQHPRYTNENFSEIVRYDLDKRQKTVLTRNGHFLSARLSPDRRRIAAISYEPVKGYPELVILNSADGSEQQRLRLPGRSATWPDWSPDGSTIYYLKQTLAGVGISTVDPASGKERELTAPSATPIDMLRVTRDGQLLYVSGASGIDNVVLHDPRSGRRQQLTNVRVGAYYPALDETGTLLYSLAVANGTDVFELGPDLRFGGEFTTASNYFERRAGYAGEGDPITGDVDPLDGPVSNFSNTLGGIRLHSWSYNGSYIQPAVELVAGNALNTFEATAGVRYNFNEDRFGYGATVRYGGLFPVLSLSVNSQDRNYTVQTMATDTFTFFRQNFAQLAVQGAATVPLRWVGGNMITSLNLTGGIELFRQRASAEGSLPTDFSGYLGDLTFSTLRRTALRQVQSRLGVTTRLRLTGGLNEDVAAGRLLAQSSVFLPGVFSTHGVRLDLDYQTEQTENRYQYVDIFRYARGYNSPLNDRVWRFGANYQLPLLYPDFGILGITYFKRIRLNAFYDYSRFTIDDILGRELTLTERSLGGQFFFDNVWLNTADLTLGVEFAYRLDPNYFSTDDRNYNFRLLFSGSF